MKISAMMFSLSRPAREKAEAALLTEALGRYQDRAKVVAKALGFPGFTLGQITITSDRPPMVPVAYRRHCNGGDGRRGAAGAHRRRQQHRHRQRVGQRDPGARQVGPAPGANRASTMTLAAAMDDALRLHRQGRLRDAFARYKAILADHPDHAPALHYLGVVLLQSGEAAGAVDVIRQAIAVDQAPAEPWANLAQALTAVGRPEAAVNALIEASRRSPAEPGIWSNLAVAELALKRYAEAEALRAQRGGGRPAACARVVQPCAGAGAPGPDPGGAGCGLPRGSDRARRARARGLGRPAAGDASVASTRPARRSTQPWRGGRPRRRCTASRRASWNGWATCPPPRARSRRCCA